VDGRGTSRAGSRRRSRRGQLRRLLLLHLGDELPVELRGELRVLGEDGEGERVDGQLRRQRGLLLLLDRALLRLRRL